MAAPLSSRPTTTCILTCYNYENFVAEALQCALSQTMPFDEIVAVDDASTDGTCQILDEIAADNPAVRVIHHERNVGQLAGFESGVLQSSGDILFFLDPDDVYSPHYLATAMQVYQAEPRCDFLYCGCRRFTGRSPFARDTATEERQVAVHDLGLSLVRTMARRAYLGNQTSCLSMRRRIADKIFPLPLHRDWRTGGDNCLVFSASLAGARKFRLDSALVGYRLHTKNAFAGNPVWSDPEVYFRKLIAKDRLFDFLVHKFGLQPDVLGLAHSEFKTIPRPRVRTFIEYSGYVLRYGARGTGRARALAAITKWYLRSRLGRHAAQDRRVGTTRQDEL